MWTCSYKALLHNEHGGTKNRDKQDDGSSDADSGLAFDCWFTWSLGDLVVCHMP